MHTYMNGPTYLHDITNVVFVVTSLFITWFCIAVFAQENDCLDVSYLGVGGFVAYRIKNKYRRINRFLSLTDKTFSIFFCQKRLQKNHRIDPFSR